jgi:hypothetical protein
MIFNSWRGAFPSSSAELGEIGFPGVKLTAKGFIPGGVLESYYGCDSSVLAFQSVRTGILAGAKNEWWR